jgi:hypothetical protein
VEFKFHFEKSPGWILKSIWKNHLGGFENPFGKITWVDFKIHLERTMGIS